MVDEDTLEQLVEDMESKLMVKGNPYEGVELSDDENSNLDYLQTKMVDVGGRRAQMFSFPSDNRIRLNGPSLPLKTKGLKGFILSEGDPDRTFLPVTFLNDPTVDSQWCADVR